MDKLPVGAVSNKGLTVRPAQRHGQRSVPELLDHVVEDGMDPSYLATHERSLEDAPRGYELFREQTDGCVRPVFTP